MDFIDYRKALGLSFSDKDKKDLFIKRVGVYMHSAESIPFEEKDEIALSYMIGENYLLADIDPFDIKMGNDPLGLQRAWLNTRKDMALFKELGNYSAHKIWYNCTQGDIKPHILKYRAIIEELFFKAGLKI